MEAQHAVKFFLIIVFISLISNFSSAINASGSGYEVGAFADVLAGNNIDDGTYSFRTSFVTNSASEINSNGYEGRVSNIENNNTDSTPITTTTTQSSGSGSSGGRSGGGFYVAKKNLTNDTTNNSVIEKTEPIINKSPEIVIKNNEVITGEVAKEINNEVDNSVESKPFIDFQKINGYTKNAISYISKINFKNIFNSYYFVAAVSIIILIILVIIGRKEKNSQIQSISSNNEVLNASQNEFRTTNYNNTNLLAEDENDRFITKELQNGKTLNEILNDLMSKGMDYDQAYYIEAKYIIKEGLNEGKSKDEIYDKLVKAGWDSKTLDDVFSELSFMQDF